MVPQSKLFSTNKTLNIGGRLLDLSMPRVMGIINVTPDSFYKDSRQKDDSILDAVAGMLNDGADIIDIGGYSSRPGAPDISTEEELRRVLPALKALKQTFPEAIFSIDTFRSEVARQALAEGAALINDISAGVLDKNMFEVTARAGVPYIMMHMRGTPQNMSQQTDYSNLLKEMTDYFHQRIHQAHQSGIKDIIIDPGFGFAKTLDQNFQILNHLHHFEILGKPILVGLSRKSMIWRTLQITPEEALNGTTALHSVALLKGASIIRTHDVKEASECIKLINALNPS